MLNNVYLFLKFTLKPFILYVSELSYFYGKCFGVKPRVSLLKVQKKRNKTNYIYFHYLHVITYTFIYYKLLLIISLLTRYYL